MDQRTIQRARQLRRDTTDAERWLWRHLRQQQLQGYRFRRPRPVGPYIADFACLRPRLVVELDGSQHVAMAEYDDARSQYLLREGFRVLRFWNHEVFENIEGVLQVILHALENHPHPNPPPEGEGAGLCAEAGVAAP